MLEMRKAFIANASHELKTPITVIRGFAETFHDNTDLPKETVQEVTSRIVDNCRRMTFIIKNLLTLADIENLPSFRVTSQSLVELIHNCSATIQSIWPDADIDLAVDVNEQFDVEIDSSLMEMAITNLLDNAAKYSEGPAKIEVTISKTLSSVVIEVKDCGIGIPESDIEHIFQRFYRVNKAHSTKLGGSGLGLSIVETIVNKHLGKIEVHSILGKGSTFTIRLPLQLADRLRALESG
jgi:signal transduction histidine kinase